MVFVTAGSRGQSMKLLFASSVKTLSEESPDCREQGVLLKRRMLRTIFRRKTSATEIIPPREGGDSSGARVKWRGKSPPGGAERHAANVNSSRSKTK